MIAVSIFGILSTITISSYANFNNRIGVDTLAHQIAQFGHEAQVSALSVKRSVNGTFPGYGIHFETASSSQIIFFADLDGDSMFDTNGSCGNAADECERTIKLLKGVTISALCGNTAGGTTDGINCKYLDSPHKAAMFDIVFKRPNPDANIIGKTIVGSAAVPYSTAQIVISSAKGYKKTITFYVTGQVTVK